MSPECGPLSLGQGTMAQGSGCRWGLPFIDRAPEDMLGC